MLFEKLSLWWKVICTSLSNFAAGISTAHHSAHTALNNDWMDECHSYACSLQLLLIKMWDPLLQNFPPQNLKCTDLLNRSRWVVGDWGNMESVLINPQACVIGQVSFTQLMIGQVTGPARNLLLTLMSHCYEIWCHSELTTFEWWNYTNDTPTGAANGKNTYWQWHSHLMVGCWKKIVPASLWTKFKF